MLSLFNAPRLNMCCVFFCMLMSYMSEILNMFDEFRFCLIRLEWFYNIPAFAVYRCSDPCMRIISFQLSFLISVYARCTYASTNASTNILQGRRTFSTSPSPRKPWLTVYRGPQVCAQKSIRGKVQKASRLQIPHRDCIRRV